MLNEVEQLVARSDIADLVSNYCHGTDKRDRALFGTLWAEDAEWEIPSFGRRWTGKEAVTAAIDETWAVWGETHHWTTNLVVTFDGDDHATGISDVHCEGTSPGGALRTVAVTNHDEFVRTSRGWKIARRVVEVHWFDRIPGVRPTAPVPTESLDNGRPR